MDESLQLLRLYWTQPSVTLRGSYYQAEAMGMAPKPLQPGGPPIWIGGDSEVALRRVGRLGDGWMALAESDQAGVTAHDKLPIIHAAAEAAGRDPAQIGLRARLSEPNNLDAVAARIAALRETGFTWATVSMPSLDAAGVHEVGAQLDLLAQIRDRIVHEVGATKPSHIA